MRLIDADRLKEVFEKNIGNPYAKGVFRQYVDMQPTICDCEKCNNWIEDMINFAKEQIKRGDNNEG